MGDVSRCRRKAKRSISLWLQGMEPQIPYEVVQTPDDLLEQLLPMAELVDFLIVDGATGLIESPLSILFRTDLVVVPCQRTGVDLHSTSDAVRSMHGKLSVLAVKIGSTKRAIATEE